MEKFKEFQIFIGDRGGHGLSAGYYPCSTYREISEHINRLGYTESARPPDSTWIVFFGNGDAVYHDKMFEGIRVHTIDTFLKMQIAQDRTYEKFQVRRLDKEWVKTVLMKGHSLGYCESLSDKKESIDDRMEKIVDCIPTITHVVFHSSGQMEVNGPHFKSCTIKSLDDFMKMEKAY